MRKLFSVASMAAFASLSLAMPSPALADAYDDCVEICIDTWMYPYNPVMYEFCRSECERKYPPGFTAPPAPDAKLD